MMLAIFPEISAAVQGGDLERVAILTRRYFSYDQPAAHPRIDVGRMVHFCGIPVTRLRQTEYGLIAAADERGSVRCSIAIRDGLEATEESFLLAHLLGHFLLHIQPRIARHEWNSSGFRDIDSPLERYTHQRFDKGYSLQQMQLEDAADRFAGALLMPAAMAQRAKSQLQDLGKVAKLFGVTTALVERRLDDLETSRTHLEVPHVEIRPAAQANAAPTVSGKSMQPSADNPSTMVREGHHKAAPMPRAVAAQSYSNHSPPAVEPAKDEPIKPVSLGKGMDRIREIARMLDKSGR